LNVNELAPPLPHSVEAERSVLGAILLDPKATLEVYPRVSEASFFLPQNRVIYRHMLLLSCSGSPIDTVTLIDSLSAAGDLDDAGGPGYVSSLPDGLPRVSNVRYYAGIVVERARFRDLIHFAESFLARGFGAAEPSVELAEYGISELLRITNDRPDLVRARPWDEVAKSAVNGLEEAKQSPAKFARMRFGLPKLDNAIAGLRRRQLCVIVAPTSNGKTLLASQLVVNASADGFKSLYFSAEMPGEQIAQRELAHRAGIKFYVTQRPEFLSARDLEKLHEAAAEAKTISIVDDDISPGRIWAMAEAKKRTSGLDLVIVDYDQLVIEAGIDPKSDDDNVFRHQRAFVFAAKRLADRLDVCVVLLCQVRKVPPGMAKGTSPRLDDVWGDSSIRNTPHLILWLVRDYFQRDMDPRYERKAMVHILKNRNGRTGHIELDFDPDYLRFRDAIDPLEEPSGR
jgi:replicative DNA helicase